MTHYFLTSYKVYAYLDSAWADLTSDCIVGPINAYGGIRGNKPDDRLAGTGEMTFQLKNTTGKYSPNGDSALTGWKRGVPVRIILTYGGVPYCKFRGFVEKIKLPTGTLTDIKVSVTVLDWMDYAAKYPVVSPGYLREVTADEALGELIPSMPITPIGTRYAVGSNEFPVVFDSTGTKTKAYTELSKLVKSESGYAYLRKNGSDGEELVFESAHTRNGLRFPTQFIDVLRQENGEPILQENGEEISIDGGTTHTFDNSMMDSDVPYGEQVINYIKTIAYPRLLDEEPQVLYSLEEPIKIGSGETIEFSANYVDPTGGGRQVNVDPSQMLPLGSNSNVGPKLSVKYYVPGSPGVQIKYFYGATHDTYARKNEPTTNFDTNTELFVGELTTGTNYVRRIWAYWEELSDGTIPANAIVIEAILSFYICADEYYTANARTCKAYRPKRDWVSAELTWNEWASGENWSTAGGFGANDCEQTDIGEHAFGLTDTGWADFELDADAIQEYIDGSWSNYGIMLMMDTELNDGYRFYSTDHLDTSQVDYSMFTIGGTNKTEYLTASAVYSSERVTFSLYNGYTSTCYIRKLQVRGIGVYSNNPIESVQEDMDSIEEYGYQDLTIEQKYQKDAGAGVIEAKKILEAHKQPTTRAKEFEFCANRSEELMLAFLRLGVGDMVEIKETKTGIDNWYYIQKVEFSIQLGGVIMFKWLVALAACSLVSGCLSPVVLDTYYPSLPEKYSAIDFGESPQISNLQYRSIYLMVYTRLFDDGVNKGILLSFASGDAGFYIFVGSTDDSNNYLRYWQNYDGTDGYWYSNSELPVDGWARCLIMKNSYTYDSPIMYIDGVKQTITEFQSPTGSFADETGCKLILNNRFDAPAGLYEYEFVGYTKDFRFFNRFLSEQEAIDITTTGVDINDGLVFHAPYVKTVNLSDYDNKSLVAADAIFDDIYGAIGTPHGDIKTQLIPYP